MQLNHVIRQTRLYLMCPSDIPDTSDDTDPESDNPDKDTTEPKTIDTDQPETNSTIRPRWKITRPQCCVSVSKVVLSVHVKKKQD